MSGPVTKRGNTVHAITRAEGQRSLIRQVNKVITTGGFGSCACPHRLYVDMILTCKILLRLKLLLDFSKRNDRPVAIVKNKCLYRPRTQTA